MEQAAKSCNGTRQTTWGSSRITANVETQKETENEMKPQPEMMQGPEARERFRNAMKALLGAPRARCLRTHSESAQQKEKAGRPQGLTSLLLPAPLALSLLLS